MRKLTVLRIVQALSVVLALAVTPFGAQAQDRPQVVAINYALQFFAEALLGDAGDVVFPVPAGIDPSFWRPSISDISTVQSADLILLNGAGFATWVDRVSLPRRSLVNTAQGLEDRFIVTETITHSHGDGGQHSHEGLASYTWLDPGLAIAQAEAIAAALSNRGLVPGDTVAARMDDLRRALEAMDAEAEAALRGLDGTPLIATHPRYQYLARRYGLSIASLEWEAGAMPSAQDLSDLSTIIAETEARVLLWEAAPPQDAIDAVKALGLESVVFPPLAQTPLDGTYTEVFSNAVAELATAAGRMPGN